MHPVVEVLRRDGSRIADRVLARGPGGRPAAHVRCARRTRAPRRARGPGRARRRRAAAGPAEPLRRTARPGGAAVAGRVPRTAVVRRPARRRGPHDRRSRDAGARHGLGARDPPRLSARRSRTRWTGCRPRRRCGRSSTWTAWRCAAGPTAGGSSAFAVLRRPDVFHAGVAGAPVTDFHLYDTFYTERYLGDPAAHADVYARDAPLTHAADAHRSAAPADPRPRRRQRRRREHVAVLGGAVPRGPPPRARAAARGLAHRRVRRPRRRPLPRRARLPPPVARAGGPGS